MENQRKYFELKKNAYLPFKFPYKKISLTFDVLLSTAIETKFEQTIINDDTHCFLDSKYVL
jgi:hypothetical protein